MTASGQRVTHEGTRWDGTRYQVLAVSVPSTEANTPDPRYPEDTWASSEREIEVERAAPQADREAGQ